MVQQLQKVVLVSIHLAFHTHSSAQLEFYILPPMPSSNNLRTIRRNGLENRQCPTFLQNAERPDVHKKKENNISFPKLCSFYQQTKDFKSCYKISNERILSIKKESEEKPSFQNLSFQS